MTDPITVNELRFVKFSSRFADAYEACERAADRIEQLEDRRKIQDELLTDKCDELKAATLRIEQLETALHKIADEYLLPEEEDSAAGLLQRWARDAMED